jgi:bifunctional DNA-binding transcriptional regulator/antitoxin component of YhaV-PrlF toxin-antitoxin module
MKVALRGLYSLLIADYPESTTMTISTLSPKNQTTLSIEFVRRLKLKPGTRLQQSIKDGKIILEPMPDVMTAYGALKSKRKFVSIEEETSGMEKAVGKAIARGDRV